ncbi:MULTISPECIES: glucose 1-dehydrogenase [unclassified Mesorhizobium]|uniref:glucose 1-dehydrogenase n=1 Tax=unclassified Mesorhizobium TaxID=325217 RepID=UPI001CCC82CD|nr:MULTISPECIES: glucose 1-dehydrogenase [unclassified Mesorhizobium]MBZ9683442.1 glucose 1-dehydrogenase [Mesorhizobium sp. CO1-1-2]MBZ9928189.1 glucose 1-dehydrogenase [Mesorhizobium sp. BR1-1-4]
MTSGVDTQDLEEKLPKQQQDIPGETNEMSPRPDHGEYSYKGSGKLEGRTAIITGGDSGIGRAVAVAFAREGADIVLAYLNEHDDARETAGWVERAARRAILVPGDVGDESHDIEIIETAMRQFGRVDILVNNAAHQTTVDDIADLTAEELDRTFRTNIYSQFFLSKAALQHMGEGASIINTASIQAADPSPQLLAYAATKGAIVNLTKGLAKMVAKRGVRVNAVAPGPVWTPLIPSTMPPEKVAEFGRNTPIGRPAHPAELAAAYVLLASADASYITGAVIAVTGGRAM